VRTPGAAETMPVAGYRSVAAAVGCDLFPYR
jgi:hypothetical protein